MKKSVILDFIYGSRGCQESISIDDYVYEKMSALGNACEKFREKLTDELRQQFDALETEYLEYDLAKMNFYSKEYFKLGLLIGVECGE